MSAALRRSSLWLVRKIGAATLLSILLLMVGLSSLVFGFSISLKGLNSWQLLEVAIAGILLAWLLARSRLPGWAAVIISAVFGLCFLTVTVGRLVGPLAGLFHALFEWEKQIIRSGAWTSEKMALINTIPIQQAWHQLFLGASTLGTRSVDWIKALVSGHPAYDPVAIILVWSLIVWCLAVWAAWFTRRRDRPLAALLPVGALLAINLAYTGASLYPLIVWIGTVVSFLALSSYTTRRRAWQANATDQAEIEGEWAMVVAFIAVALMSCAAVIPSFSINQIAQRVEQQLAPGQESSRAAAEAFGLKPPAPPPGRLASSYTPGLPNLHLLGSGPELSRKVVLYVTLAGSQLISTQTTPVDQTSSFSRRYYWRGLSYDIYTGHGWFTTPNQLVEYQAGQLVQTLVLTPDNGVYELVRQHIQAKEDLGRLIYAAGTLITVSQDFKVTLRSPEDMFGAETQGGDYWVDSRLPIATADQLRTAGANYPDWVASRYLTLPDEVPMRVRQLALDLTAIQPTPYDRALAIEAYLRKFPYTLELPTPPAARDVADYFLFDLKRGYCDYYATAMVVLARAAGLPARLVTGYANGSYDPQQARYTVTEADAHSWVEVYFPSYGWIEFEPTGGRPALERSGESGQSAIPPYLPGQPLPPITELANRTTARWPWVLVGMAILALLGWLLWRAIDLFWLKRLSPANASRVLYRRLRIQAGYLQIVTMKTTTPLELALQLGQRLRQVLPAGYSQNVSSWVSRAVIELASLYSISIYSSHTLDEQEKVEAIQIWRELQPYLWRAWIWDRLRRMRRNTR